MLDTFVGLFDSPVATLHSVTRKPSPESIITEIRLTAEQKKVKEVIAMDSIEIVYMRGVLFTEHRSKAKSATSKVQ